MILRLKRMLVVESKLDGCDEKWFEVVFDKSIAMKVKGNYISLLF